MKKCITGIHKMKCKYSDVKLLRVSLKAYVVMADQVRQGRVWSVLELILRQKHSLRAWASFRC